MRFPLRLAGASCALALALQIAPPPALAAAASVTMQTGGGSVNLGSLDFNSVTLQLDLLGGDTVPVATTLTATCSFSGDTSSKTTVTFNVGPGTASPQIAILHWTSELAKVAGSTLSCRPTAWGSTQASKCVANHTADLMIPKTANATGNAVYSDFGGDPIQLKISGCTAAVAAPAPPPPPAPSTTISLMGGNKQSVARAFSSLVPVVGGVAVFQPLTVQVKTGTSPVVGATVTFTCAALPSDYKCQFTAYGTDNGVWAATTDAFGNATIPATMWVWKPTNPTVNGSHAFTVTVTGPNGSKATFNETVTN